jgi:hypothetical protein
MIPNARLLLLPLLFSCSLTQADIHHVLLIWLKEPGNKLHRQQVIDATRQLASIPELKQLRLGEPVASERAHIDDSFDVGIYMTFADEAAMGRYIQDENHKIIVRDKIKPIIEKVIGYDFYDAR